MAYIRIEKTDKVPGYRLIVTNDELARLENYRRVGPAKTLAELEDRIGRKFTSPEIEQAMIDFIPVVSEPKMPRYGRRPVAVKARGAIQGLRNSARHKLILV